MTCPLIDAALEKGLPCLFICRGFQELNAALGGTLHACLHEVEGRFDHRMPRVDDRDVRYGLRHGMSFTPGGRSEEHTSELQPLMRISYAFVCLNNKTKTYVTPAG